MSMIEYQDQYLEFIRMRGVGKNDLVADSCKSYKSYLHSVSKLIGENISPDILKSEADIINIERELNGRRASRTIANYRSAMRQYIAFVESESLA